MRCLQFASWRSGGDGGVRCATSALKSAQNCAVSVSENGGCWTTSAPASPMLRWAAWALARDSAQLFPPHTRAATPSSGSATKSAAWRVRGAGGEGPVARGGERDVAPALGPAVVVDQEAGDLFAAVHAAPVDDGVGQMRAEAGAHGAGAVDHA